MAVLSASMGQLFMLTYHVIDLDVAPGLQIFVSMPMLAYLGYESIVRRHSKQLQQLTSAASVDRIHKHCEWSSQQWRRIWYVLH